MFFCFLLAQFLSGCAYLASKGGFLRILRKQASLVVDSSQSTNSRVAKYTFNPVGDCKKCRFFLSQVGAIARDSHRMCKARKQRNLLNPVSLRLTLAHLPASSRLPLSGVVNDQSETFTSSALDGDHLVGYRFETTDM